MISYYHLGDLTKPFDKALKATEMVEHIEDEVLDIALESRK